MRKIVKIVFIIFIIIFSINSLSYSADIKGDADSFLEAGNSAGQITSLEMKNEVNEIAGLLTGIGVSLIVIVGVVLGIKFMMASTEEQAKIKEAVIPYAIGSVIIFGALGIWTIVVNVLNEAT